MAINISGGQIINCGVGVLAHKDADVTLKDGYLIDKCGIGVSAYASAEELMILQKISQDYIHDIQNLTEKLKNTEPQLRKGVLMSSAVFSALSVGSNASTVFQFLIDNYHNLAELIKDIPFP